MIDGKQPKQYNGKAYFQDFEFRGNGDGITIRAGYSIAGDGARNSKREEQYGIIAKTIADKDKKNLKEKGYLTYDLKEFENSIICSASSSSIA